MVSCRQVSGSVLLALFAIAQIGFSTLLIVRKYDDSTDSGSCCLPQSCDVTRLNTANPIARTVGNNFCELTHEQLQQMGCAESVGNWTKSCGLSEPSYCNVDMSVVEVLASSIVLMVGGIFMFVVSCIMMCCWGDDDTCCDASEPGRIVSMIMWVFVVVLGIVGLVFAGLMLHRVTQQPFTTAVAKKCSRWSSEDMSTTDDAASSESNGNELGRSSHHSSHKSRHCVAYNYATFFDGASNDYCTLDGQRANVLSWLVRPKRLEIPIIVMVALPCVEIVVGIIIGLTIIFRVCCDCCPCDDCCSGGDPLDYHSRTFSGKHNDRLVNDTDGIYSPSAQKQNLYGGV